MEDRITARPVLRIAQLVKSGVGVTLSLSRLLHDKRHKTGEGRRGSGCSADGIEGALGFYEIRIVDSRA